MSRAAGPLGLERASTRAVVQRSGSGATRARRVGDAGPVLLRLRVYLTRGMLDRRIAGAVALDATPALALRARQLASASLRQSSARNLRHTVAYAERVESRPRLSAVMLEPARVRAGRSAILRLAERLDRAGPVSPQGVALARVLLTDAASPLFDLDSERTVIEASCIAEDALVCGQLAPPANP
jgi:hypothetical protein